MTRTQKLSIAAVVVAYLLIVVEGVLPVTAGDDACRSAWPVCRDGSLPTSLSANSAFEIGYQLLALTAFGLTFVLIGSLARAGARWLLLPVMALVILLVRAGLVAFGPADGSTFPVVAHIGLSEALLVVTITLMLAALAPRISETIGRRWTAVGHLSLVASFLLFCLTLTGAYTSTMTGTCSEWPLCGGRYVPSGLRPLDLDLTHRWLALLASLALLGVAIQARRRRSDVLGIVGLANAAVVLMLAQIFVGAANIWFELNPIVSAAHLGVATIILGLAVALVALDRMVPASEDRAAVGALPSLPLRQVWRDYVILTKPGVMTLLLVTTLGAMLIAQAGLPPLRIIFWTLIGGALASGGAAAINHYVDRDIDAIMSRTRTRPLPGGRIPPVYVPIFGVTLSVLAVYVLAVFVNPLAAMLSLAGNLFYVFVYTMWLKRSTPQNIVIGGAAGAVPPLVGWAAVTNQVTVPALLLFAVIFYWTPPHFWALALFKSTDYAAAGVPMFPEVYGEAETRRHIFLYTILMVLVSFFFFPLRVMGPFYLVCALVLGGVFLYKSYVLLRRPANDNAMARSLFFYSIRYLGLLFLVMVVDRLIWF